MVKPRYALALLPVVAGLCYHALNDFRPLDVYYPKAQGNASVDEHFSENYYQARALFRQRAKAADATLHTLPMEHLADLDLSIDIAVIKGSEKRVLLHVSGTHGVEGFTGSAIQSGILQQVANDGGDAKGPTVVLIHALNPYGYSQLRRANENNVDLNRNWLSSEEFRELKDSDPNQSGYVDVLDALLPSVESTSMFGQTLMTVIAKGFPTFKRAMVSGTYHFAEGILFGGFEKQPSLVMVEEFLPTIIAFDKVESLVVVDVHTGLGPAGIDTLILMPECNQTLAERVFEQEKREGLVSPMVEGTDNAVTKGYSDSRGFISTGLAQLLPPSRRENVVVIGQEFGTIAPLFVIKAVTAENAIYHQAPGRRLPFAERLRDAFYVHQSASWKKSVLERGLGAYHKLHAHLQQ